MSGIKRFRRSRFGRGLSVAAAGLAVLVALSGCGCRPGYIGPYGGIHPGRCWVG